MSTNAKKKYLETFSQDEKGKYGLEHADGTPCDAKTPDACPKEHKAQQADELAEAEKKSTGVSSPKCKVGERLDVASPDLHDLEYEAMDDELHDIVNTYSGDHMELEYSLGDFIGSFKVKCDIVDSYIDKNADGKWAAQQIIVPLDPQGDFDAEKEKFNKHMAPYGVGVDKFEFDEDDVDGIKRGPGRSLYDDGDLTAYGKLGGFPHMVVTDPQKFQEFKDSFKEGGSRRTEDLDERVKEDIAWKATPEYKAYIEEERRKYPALYAAREKSSKK